MNLPINALCIAIAGSLFAYMTGDPLFIIAAAPIAGLVGLKEIKNDCPSDDKVTIASDFHSVDEDAALERRLAQFRKALHG